MNCLFPLSPTWKYWDINLQMRQKVSISKWVEEQIRFRVDPVHPVDYENLFGSIDDDTFTEPEDVAPGSDTARENL